jgi:hypothetical protein
MIMHNGYVFQFDGMTFQILNYCFSATVCPPKEIQKETETKPESPIICDDIQVQEATSSAAPEPVPKHER